VSPSETATTSRRTQAERRQVAERALLAAAARLFARRGTDNVSLAEIGDEAGYSRGLVNHRFGSRAALVERLAELAQTDFVHSLPQPARGEEAGVLLDLASSYLDHVARADTESRAFLVMWGAAFPEDSPLRPVFIAGDRRFRDGVETLVRAGQDHGSISAGVDPRGFAVALVALLRGIAAQTVVDPAGVDTVAARAAAAAFIQAALTPQPAGPDHSPSTGEDTRRNG
jgi:AcrR family transcriptional regulator